MLEPETLNEQQSCSEPGDTLRTAYWIESAYKDDLDKEIVRWAPFFYRDSRTLLRD